MIDSTNSGVNYHPNSGGEVVAASLPAGAAEHSRLYLFTLTSLTLKNARS